MKKTLITVSILAFTLNAFAGSDETDANLGAHFMLTGGLTYGGDKLATITYTNGDNVDIHGGGLILFGAGGVYRFEKNWETQLSINYQFDKANAKNGDATFDRFPIDLLGFYRSGAHRFGAGVTYHINPKYDANFDIANGKQKVDFDNALGAVIEYDYFFNNSVSLGVRYANIKYKSSDIAGSVDGSYGGVLVNGYF